MVALLGDRSESELATIVKGDNPRVISLAGKTTTREAMALLRKCTLFMGADSGLMHLAAALDTPTLTFWGPSDRTLYGWEQIDPTKHSVITRNLDCGPCNSWLNPNTTRVKDPGNCPDHQCMKDITVEQAFDAFEQHWQQIQNHRS